MFKHGAVSIEVDKKPFLFTLVALIGSTAAAVLLFVLGRGNALSVIAGILAAVVAVASLVVMFAMLTDYAYVDQGVLFTRYLFKKTRIPLKDIGRVTCVENVYYVYGRNDNLIGTVNGLLSGIDNILNALENNGVCFM